MIVAINVNKADTQSMPIFHGTKSKIQNVENFLRTLAHHISVNVFAIPLLDNRD